MIKKSFRLMLLVAFALSSVMFVACNKYDDDIERIDNEIASLQATVQSLKAAVDGGAVISSVSNTAEGVKFTLSNGQSYVVNHGTAGADGAAGKDGSVVTIGENGNWFIDGEDTGKTAKGQGEPGKSPRINEAGNWEVWNPETETWDDTKVSAAGAQTYVVDCGSYYELNVMQQVDGANAGFTTIKLSKTAPITSLTVVSPSISNNVYDVTDSNGDSWQEYNNERSWIVLNYGAPLSSDITFNEKPYAAGTNLIPAGSSLIALVNPVDADASVYDFALMDSHGNKPYVITSKTKYSTTNPLGYNNSLTKAANIGYWAMSIKLADGLKYQDVVTDDYVVDGYSDSRSARAYALTTMTANGQIASKYDVNVLERKVSTIDQIELNDITKYVTESINLMNAFSDATYLTGVVDNSKPVARINNSFTVSDLKPYVIDAYFKIADATKAEKYGLKLEGNTLTAEKPTNDDEIVIKAYYLLADGTMAKGTTALPADEFKVKFAYATPGADALAVEWTVTNDETDVTNGIKAGYQHVFMPLGDLQTSLKGADDYDLPDLAAKSGWTPYSKSYHMDNYTYIVNDKAYGVDQDPARQFTGHEDTWITTVDMSNLYYKDGSKYYKATSSTKIQTPLYVKFTFNSKDAFPGEYKVTLKWRKGNTVTTGSDYDVQVPVKVTIKSPAESDVNPFQRLSAYFSGDNAVAYGTADGSYAYYNLFSLFADMSGEENNVTFTETKHQISGHSCAPWLVDETSGDIKVGASRYTPNTSDNRDGVYNTREFKAKYVVFGNEHIPYINDTFNLTIKSAIAEGTFSTTASKTIETSNPVYFSVSDFTTVDVSRDKYYLGKTYVYDTEAGAYTNTAVTGTGLDDRIMSIRIYAADDNAENYLTIDGVSKDSDGYVNSFGKLSGYAAADAFTVARKSTVTRLTQDTPCKVTVRITDKWGRRSEATVTVVLKAFGN